MGRFGNVMLVNGEPRYDLAVKRGEIVRFYLTNASNARLFNLSFPGARMKVVASDVGKFEREEWVSSVVLAPAERYVVDVEFARAGARGAGQPHSGARPHVRHVTRRMADTLGVVRVSRSASVADAMRAEFARLTTQRAMSRPRSRRFDRLFDAPPSHSLVLTMRTRGLPAAVSNMLIGINAAVEWNDGMAMMNWIATGKEVKWVLRDPETGKENMDIDWRFRVGRGREDSRVQRSVIEPRHGSSAPSPRPALSRRESRRRTGDESGVEGHGRSSRPVRRWTCWSTWRIRGAG